MNFIVTGGAGFIGSHLCDALVEDGHCVLCIDNFVTGEKKNLSGLDDSANFSLLKVDISEQVRVEGHVDWVLHFASPASPIDYLKLPIETMKAGSAGTLNLLELAKEKGASFLLASSSEVYGDPAVHPQKEDYWGNVNPVGPRAVYDEAKRFSEALAVAYRRTHAVNSRIVRIFNTFGPRMRRNDGRVVPAFIGQALSGSPLTVFGDGTQTRSFCYVSDLVKGIMRMVEVEEDGPVNMGNPNEISIMDFAKLVISITGSSSRIVYRELPEDDPRVRKPDITLAKNKLGWQPEVSLKEGLVKTIEWFRGSRGKA